MPATFGARLHDLRKQRRLTQRQLAERVAARLKEKDRRGFDFTYLSKIENDRLPPPSVAAIMDLAAELDTDSDELLALAGKEKDRRGFDFTYLSKIENDRLPPPSVAAIMDLAAELDTDSDELLALAGKAPPDLGEKLKDSPAARQFYRSAIDLNLSDDEWKTMLRRLKGKR